MAASPRTVDDLKQEREDDANFNSLVQSLTQDLHDRKLLSPRASSPALGVYSGATGSVVSLQDLKLGGGSGSPRATRRGHSPGRPAARGSERTDSRLPLFGGGGNIINLTPRSNVQEPKRPTGKPQKHCGSESDSTDVEGADLAFYDAQVRPAGSGSSLDGDVVAPPRVCSLSVPVVVLVLMLNVAAVGCIVFCVLSPVDSTR